MSEPIEIPVLDATVQKYLLRAGTDSRCTPKVLREKTEAKMGLAPGTLDHFKPRIKKLIIKWWKEGGKEAAAAVGGDGETKVKTEPAAASAPVPPTAEEIATWKALKQFAKATGKSEGLLANLNEINVASKRIGELRKRIKAEGYELKGESPTAEEIEAVQSGKNKRPLEGGDDTVPSVKKEKGE